MKYLSVFSVSSYLRPVFITLKAYIVSYLRDWSFQDFEKREFLVSVDHQYVVKPGRKKYLF